MTREEAIRHLTSMRIHSQNRQLGKDIEALDRAVEALEQEPVLDKIRAEIIEMRSKQNVGVLECLDIIDKYKAESEGENDNRRSS